VRLSYGRLGWLHRHPCHRSDDPVLAGRSFANIFALFDGRGGEVPRGFVRQMVGGAGRVFRGRQPPAVGTRRSEQRGILTGPARGPGVELARANPIAPTSIAAERGRSAT
jgi:hypothetical protein